MTRVRRVCKNDCEKDFETGIYKFNYAPDKEKLDLLCRERKLSMSEGEDH